MKRALLLTTLAMTIGSSAFASSINYPSFQGEHKPMSFKMASTEDMKAYTKDLENYLADTDAVIQMLITKKRAVIDAYNAGVREYNKDDFFHKDRVEPYSYDESTMKQIQGCSSLIYMSYSLSVYTVKKRWCCMRTLYYCWHFIGVPIYLT